MCFILIEQKHKTQRIAKVLLVCAALLLASSAHAQLEDWQPPTPSVTYIDQQLDHFNFETCVF